VFARAGHQALTLHVADRGNGLPPAARRALLGAATDGDGMGLGIVADLTTTMHGRLRATRMATGMATGTRISVRLPYGPQEDTA